MGLQAALGGEPQFSVRSCWSLHEPKMLHRRLIAPEVLPADVTEGEPDAGMHGVVVDRIDILDRRMIASDLHASRQSRVCEIRSQNLFIAKNEVDDRLTTKRDPQAILLFRNAEACCCRRMA